jgi:hypothetical protein
MNKINYDVKQLSFLIESIHGFHSAQYGDHIRVIGNLYSALRSTDIEIMQEEMYHRHDTEEWIKRKRYSEIKRMRLTHQRMEQGMYLLVDIKYMKKPEDELPDLCFNEMNYGISGFLEVLYKECLQYVEMYLRDIYKDMTVIIKEENSIIILNQIVSSQDLLLIKPREYRNDNTEIDSQLVFMIGEFDGYFENALHTFICNVKNEPDLLEHDLIIKHANQDIPGSITPQIWKWIREAVIIIVVIKTILHNGKLVSNFNVAYEYGIAKAYSKNIIVLIDEDSYREAGRLPFDVKDDRCIFFDPKNLDAIKDQLARFIATAVASKEKWPRATVDGLV